MATCRSIPAQRKTLSQHDSLQSSSAPGKGGFMHRLANRMRHVRLSVRDCATTLQDQRGVYHSVLKCFMAAAAAEDGCCGS